MKNLFSFFIPEPDVQESNDQDAWDAWDEASRFDEKMASGAVLLRGESPPSIQEGMTIDEEHAKAMALEHATRQMGRR